MPVKREWHAASNGPDVLDVTMIMNAIGTLHSAHVALVVSPGQTSSGSPVDLAMSALFDVLPGSSLPAAVGVHSTWPNSKGTSFWGECYNLAWTLDHQISLEYQNEELWK